MSFSLTFHTTTTVPCYNYYQLLHIIIIIMVALQSIQTASATVHTYETLSGLRFALYTSNDVPTCKLSDTTAISASAVSAGGTNYYSPTPTPPPGSNSTASTTSGNAMLTASSSTPYTTTYNSNNHQSTSSMLESNTTIFGRDALVHIYSNIWVECVVRSPLYVGNSGGDALMECIKSTTFEKELDVYISSLPWFQS